ncbi:hypothetical protein [Mucilaginibacter sp.]|uniref:hypothetical protein n=1 Tax=Mucilaginibacter sp. TaxID=1882438 RepID=UPI00261EED3A|nr:hypothetical protein [Mucilaginibacter sp.]MDB4922931.1 hypothetical protein [Mucilaginibacter sp.]
MKKFGKKLISLAIAEVWISLFKVNDNRPAFPNGGDRRKMIAEFIQLTAKEEKKFWAIYDKLQSKNVALTAEKMEEAGLLRIKSIQPEERSALFSDLIFNWVNDVTDLYGRQTDKMRKEVGKKKSIAFLNIEMNFYAARLESMMAGRVSSSHQDENKFINHLNK